MAHKILWIDDEYNRYDELLSKFEKTDIEFDHADSYEEAKQKLACGIEQYGAIILDIILPEGKHYTLEEFKAGKFKYRPYWGLTLLEELSSGNQKLPKVLVLTIVEDQRVNTKLERQIKKGAISDVLRKGMLTEQDFYDAVTELF